MDKKLKEAFKLIKFRQPSILVIEDIDFFCSKSKSAMTQPEIRDLFYTFLSELDSLPIS
jgi:hypothetical protein